MSALSVDPSARDPSARGRLVRKRADSSVKLLVKKTGDCGSPPTPKKPKADSERLVAARV